MKIDTALTITTAPAVEPVSMQEIKEHLRIDTGDQQVVDNAAAVDKTGGKVGIPVTANSLSTAGGEWVTFAGTTNYNGSFLTDEDTTVNEVVIEATYVAETFAGDEVMYYNGEENDLLAGYIAAARGYAEGFQNRAYITTAFKLTLDRFPIVISPPRPPLISVTSIKYYDTDGVQQTLSADVYTVDVESEPGRIALGYNQSWPAIRNIINAVEVNFTAGYGTAGSDVPATIKQAIKLLVSHYYCIRQPVIVGTGVAEVPDSVKSLLSLNKVY